MRIIPVLMIVLLSGCSFTNTYVNRASDQKSGVELTRKFYQYTKEKDLDKVFSIFNLGERADDIADKKEKIKTLLSGVSENLGEVTSLELLTNHTKVIEGNKVTGEYKIVFKVKRSDRPSFFKESFTLYSENGKIKIADYFINPI